MADLGGGQTERGSLDKLVRKMGEDRSIDLGLYRRTYLERRLASRMRALGLTTYKQYADALDRDSDEYAHFLQALTINVTQFFRDPGMWAVLQESVIPSILAEKIRRHGHTLRVWSAGCATGEEAYSLAMAFLEALEAEPRQMTLAIRATDIDPDALAIARTGIYASEKRAQIPDPLGPRYTLGLDADSAGTFQINPDVRRLVRVESYSLFDAPPMKLVDLVMCRNVFIYFDRPEQSRVLDGFWNAMSPGAYLVLGRSERLSADAYSHFETIDSKERVYRKPTRT